MRNPRAISSKKRSVHVIIGTATIAMGATLLAGWTGSGTSEPTPSAADRFDA